jgi:hypothetical protein
LRNFVTQPSLAGTRAGLEPTIIWLEDLAGGWRLELVVAVKFRWRLIESEWRLQWCHSLCIQSFGQRRVPPRDEMDA